MTIRSFQSISPELIRKDIFYEIINNSDSIIIYKKKTSQVFKSCEVPLL
jgi:hypothetical protein